MMNAATGKGLDILPHIRQSIHKIITTPIGSRVMRRPFGSIIPELIDSPINPRTRLLVMAATATAVIKWEPRIRPSKITMTMGNEPSMLTVELTATLKDGPAAGQLVQLSVPLLK